MEERVKYLILVVAPTIATFLILSFALEINLIAFIILYVLIYMLGCNTMFHRYWAHKQFKMSPFCERILTFFGLFAMVGDPISFSRTHRWHHKHADTALDVHRPTLGFYESFIGWQFRDFNPPLTIIKDLLRVQYLITLAKHQIKIIWTTFFILAFVAPTILYTLMSVMIISWFLEMLTNYIAHDKDGAKNIKVLAVLSSGPLHRDHHDNPGK